MLPGRCAPRKLNNCLGRFKFNDIKTNSLSPIKFPNDRGNSLVQFLPRCKHSTPFISCKIFGNFLILSHFSRLKYVRDFIARQFGRVSSFLQPKRSHTLSLSRRPTESSISTKFVHHRSFNVVTFGDIDKLGIFLIWLHQVKSTCVTDTKFCRKKKLKVRTWFNL
ncbi:hypothetical protein ACB098_11G193500 [Castanea mollissima]